jgi:hypothetical protein
MNSQLQRLTLTRDRRRETCRIDVLSLRCSRTPVIPGSVQNLTNEAEAETVFLELLAKANKQGMST